MEVRILGHKIDLIGIAKTIRTDKATTLSGKTLRDLCKSPHIKPIYWTPFIHTTGSVGRGVKTLNETQLTNIKAEEAQVRL